MKKKDELKKKPGGLEGRRNGKGEVEVKEKKIALEGNGE